MPGPRTTPALAPSLAPGARVVVRDEEWVVRSTRAASQLLAFHNAALEAEHIDKGIEDGTEPEALFAEPPSTKDFLADLFGPPSEPSPTLSDPLRLFGAGPAGDLAYAAEAFEQTLGDERELLEWAPEAGGFVLHPPDDLKTRFDLLPRGLREQKGPLRLTTDRGRVMASLDEARRTSDAWPEWQLFWDLHPVAGWLDDRVLQSFRRHEAPVIRVAQGLEPDEVVFVFQGVLSNANGRPLHVDWFGVPYRAGRKSAIRPLAELIEATGLAAGPPNANDIAEDELASLEALRAKAVDAARAHLKRAADRRTRELESTLRDSLVRLERWQQRRSAARGERRARIQAKRGLTVFEQRGFEQQKAREQSVLAIQLGWVNASLSSGGQSYIRLACAAVY